MQTNNAMRRKTRDPAYAGYEWNARLSSVHYTKFIVLAMLGNVKEKYTKKQMYSKNFHKKKVPLTIIPLRDKITGQQQIRFVS